MAGATPPQTDISVLTSQKWDAVIVGGGHNGLTSAAYLAKSGLKVLVLERRHIVGGAAVTEEMTDGFHFSRCSYLLSLLRPQIIKDLALTERHGLEWFVRDPSSYTPTPNMLTSPVTGRKTTGLTLFSDNKRTHDSIAQYSRADADAYGAYCSSMSSVASAFTEILDMPPPELQHLARVVPAFKAFAGQEGGSAVSRDAARAAMRLAGDSGQSLWGLTTSVARLGVDIPLLWEVLTGPASRILDRWFESSALKATLATDGVIGADVAPGTPGSAYVLLHHVMGGVDGNEGAWAYVRGGMGAVSTALAGAAREAGATIVTDAEVTGIEVDEQWSAAASTGRGAQWRLSALAGVSEAAFGTAAPADGKIQGVSVRLAGSAPVAVEADAVLCGAAPGVLFGDLLSRQQCARFLPPDTWSRLQSFDTAPAAAKLNVALRGLPAFPQAGDDPSLPVDLRRAGPHHQCTIHFEEDMHEITVAHAEAKAQGRPSPRPVVELTMPSVLDDSLAPPGCHVANLFVQYAPLELTHPEWAAGWKDEGVRRRFMDSVYDVVERSAPGFRDLVLHEDLLTPLDLEEQIGLPSGNIFHGAMSVDQLLWMRPAPGMSRHRTPIGGLYICGSGAHPGGGVMGAPGRNAANILLQDRARA